MVLKRLIGDFSCHTSRKTAYWKSCGASFSAKGSLWFGLCLLQPHLGMARHLHVSWSEELFHGDAQCEYTPPAAKSQTCGISWNTTATGTQREVNNKVDSTTGNIQKPQVNLKHHKGCLAACLLFYIHRESLNPLSQSTEPAVSHRLVLPGSGGQRIGQHHCVGLMEDAARWNVCGKLSEF